MVLVAQIAGLRRKSNGFDLRVIDGGKTPDAKPARFDSVGNETVTKEELQILFSDDLKQCMS